MTESQTAITEPVQKKRGRPNKYPPELQPKPKGIKSPKGNRGKVCLFLSPKQKEIVLSMNADDLNMFLEMAASMYPVFIKEAKERKEEKLRLTAQRVAARSERDLAIKAAKEKWRIGKKAEKQNK